MLRHVGSLLKNKVRAEFYINNQGLYNSVFPHHKDTAVVHSKMLYDTLSPGFSTIKYFIPWQTRLSDGMAHDVAFWTLPMISDDDFVYYNRHVPTRAFLILFSKRISVSGYRSAEFGWFAVFSYPGDFLLRSNKSLQLQLSV